MLPQTDRLKGYEGCQKLLLSYPKPKTLAIYFSPEPIFSDEECDALVTASESKPYYNQHVVINNKPVLNISANGANVNYFCEFDAVAAPFYEKLIKLVQIENQQLWNFKIIDFGEPLKVSCYTEGRGTCVHKDLDHDSNSVYRKLTVVVQLSDDKTYEGGNLLISDGGVSYSEAPRAKGSVIIFPSFLQHMVSIVVKGKRNSVVMFAYGPPFC